MRVNIPPSKYVSHVALVSSNCMTSSGSLEERCDTLMEDDVQIDTKLELKYCRVHELG
jgi:hypothetical protein